MEDDQGFSEYRAAEIFSMAQVNEDDQNWAVPKYAKYVRSTLWFFPTYFWLGLAWLSVAGIYFDWLAPWGRLGSAAVLFFAAIQYGSRTMVFDYFNGGFELGKAAGVLRGLDLKPAQWEEISEKGHNFIVECEAGSFEIDEELTKE